MVWYCLGMPYDLQNTIPIPTHDISAVLGMVFAPQIIINGLSTLALVCYATSEKKGIHARWIHIRSTCFSFSHGIIIDGLSTPALVCSMTSKKKYPCPLDTYLQCFVWLCHTKALLTDGIVLPWYAP